MYNTIQKGPYGDAAIKRGSMVQPQALIHENGRGERLRNLEVKVQRDWNEIFLETGLPSDSCALLLYPTQHLARKQGQDFGPDID